MKYLKRFNESLKEDDVKTAMQALSDTFDFDLAFNNTKDRAVCHSTDSFDINENFIREIHKLNAKLKSMGYESSAIIVFNSSGKTQTIKSTDNLDEIVSGLSKYIGSTNVRTLLRIKQNSLKSEHDRVFDEMCSIVAESIDYDYWEDTEGSYVIGLYNTNGTLIGMIEYHDKPEVNPFYSNGEYPNNKYVFEINDATEEDGFLDLDNIRLVPVIDGKFNRRALEAFLLDFDV
jgi:hypothetical protein